MGFRKSWYSWRHQLKALADAGFKAVAPDMRGYGQTDAPAEIEKYTLLHLVGDMVGVLDALGAETAVIAGHDWAHRSPGTRRNCGRTVSRRDRLERAVPAPRLVAADQRDAANRRGNVLSTLLSGAGCRRSRA